LTTVLNLCPLFGYASFFLSVSLALSRKKKYQKMFSQRGVFRGRVLGLQKC
jgi:hypothetical protein